MDQELEAFKQFDLRQYAASIGYVVDRRESSRNSTVMRRDHDKIIVSLKPDGHYTYWSPRNDRDHGTIIDFIQKRKKLTLGGVRKELRAWARTPPPALPQFRQLATTSKNLTAVRRRYASMRITDRHAYLEDERGIPAYVLQHPRFVGRIRIDRYGAGRVPTHGRRRKHLRI